MKRISLLLCILFSFSLLAEEKPVFEYPIFSGPIRFLKKKYSPEFLKEKYELLTKFTDFDRFMLFWNGKGPLHDLRPATFYMYLHQKDADATYKKIVYNIIKANGYFPYNGQSELVLPFFANNPNILSNNERYFLLSFMGLINTQLEVDIASTQTPFPLLSLD